MGNHSKKDQKEVVMKKVYFMVLLCIPILLFLGFKTSNAIGVNGQAAQTPEPSWGMETDNISMAEVGKLLERLGKEIQEKGEFTAGDKTFALKGQGSLEWGARSMPGGTSLQIEIGTRERPPRGNTYVAYDVSGGRPATAADAAEVLAKIGKTLASKDIFVIDEHSVSLEGRIVVTQRMTETVRGKGRGRSMPYMYSFDVVFGKQRFPVPQDEQDNVEAEQRGWVKELAINESMDVDKEAVVKLFEQLSTDLKEGRVSIGETSLPAGDMIQFGISHLVATEGNSNRIRFAMQFGPAAPQARMAGPRYSKELFDEPMKKVGALLKRMGTEILEKGAFKLGENEFKVKELATYEISASSRGFSIELSYIETNKDK
jgi:hypothetical protein